MILWVEDNVELLEIYLEYCSSSGLDFIGLGSAREGLEYFKRSKLSLVITDGNLPAENGIWLGQEIRKIDGNVPLFLFSSDNALVRSKEAQEIFNERIYKTPNLEEILLLIKQYLVK